MSWLQRAWLAYGAALERRPILTKSASAFVIFTTADTLRQTYEHFSAAKAPMAPAADSTVSIPASTPGPAAAQLSATHSQQPNNIGWFDPARAVRLSTFYALVHAPWVHTWFGMLDRFYGASTGFKVVLRKVLTDQIVSMPPFMFIMLFTTGVMRGLSVDSAFAKAQRDHVETMTGAALTWIPALAFNFAFVAPKYRLLFVNTVQVFFGIFLSKITNKVPTPAPTGQALRPARTTPLS